MTLQEIIDDYRFRSSPLKRRCLARMLRAVGPVRSHGKDVWRADGAGSRLLVIAPPAGDQPSPAVRLGGWTGGSVEVDIRADYDSIPWAADIPAPTAPDHVPSGVARPTRRGGLGSIWSR